MKNETFSIKSYGKSELALMYFPDSTKAAALRKLQRWMQINPRLRDIKGKKAKFFTPKQVKAIIDELGEPFY